MGLLEGETDEMLASEEGSFDGLIEGHTDKLGSNEGLTVCWIVGILEGVWSCFVTVISTFAFGIVKSLKVWKELLPSLFLGELGAFGIMFVLVLAATKNLEYRQKEKYWEDQEYQETEKGWRNFGAPHCFI